MTDKNAAHLYLCSRTLSMHNYLTLHADIVHAFDDLLFSIGEYVVFR